MSSKRYRYETDDFVVSDSEAEQETRKSKPSRRHGKHHPQFSKVVKKTNSPRKRTKKSHDDGLLQELLDLAPYNHPSVNATPDQQSTGIDLLKLPGELRNRIYEILLKDEEEVAVKKQSSAEGSRRSSRQGAADKPRFQSYALAQTCQQLRTEYLPWLRQNRRIRIDLMELYDYLDTFHPAVNSAESNSREEGHVEPIWHDFAIAKGIDVLQLAKINGASPNLHFYLEPSMDEVRLPDYHELTTMSQILTSYPQWRHLIKSARLQSIRLISDEDDTSWYKYNRRIELRCGRALPGSSEHRRPLLSSWVYKSGMAYREDLRVFCNTGNAYHDWKHVTGDWEGTLRYTWSMKDAIEDGGQVNVREDRLKPDGGELGYTAVNIR